MGPTGTSEPGTPGEEIQRPNHQAWIKIFGQLVNNLENVKGKVPETLREVEACCESFLKKHLHKYHCDGFEKFRYVPDWYESSRHLLVESKKWKYQNNV